MTHQYNSHEYSHKNPCTSASNPIIKNAYQLLLEQKIANNPNNYHYNNISNIKIDLKIHIAHE